MNLLHIAIGVNAAIGIVSLIVSFAGFFKILPYRMGLLEKQVTKIATNDLHEIKVSIKEVDDKLDGVRDRVSKLEGKYNGARK